MRDKADEDYGQKILALRFALKPRFKKGTKIRPGQNEDLNIGTSRF